MARPSGERMTGTDRAAEEPVTTARVPLADVLVDEEVLAAVHEAVASGWWSMGPRVAEFEEAFAAFSGARHAIAVSSGTAALHLALLAAGCGPGDEVVLPSLNFVAAANMVLHTGARPVFCDIGGRLDLNLVDHLGNTFHHIFALENSSAKGHNVRNALPIACGLHNLGGQNGDRFGIIELEATRLTFAC